MNTSSFYRIIFFIVSFGFIFINILIANFPGGSFSLILLILRDSWVIPFIILLIYSKEFELLSFIISSIVLGLIPLIYSDIEFNFFTFFYGFRDICLISFVMFFLKNPFYVKKNTYRMLLIIIFGFALAQLISQYLGNSYFLDQIFKTQEYYTNKGITSNTIGGFFGERLTIPFYSSSLLGTFCAFYFFQSNYIGKILSAIIGLFTLSKAVILIPIFYLFKKFYKSFILMFLLTLLSLRSFIDYFIENNATSIISFHLGSIRDRFKSVDMIFERFPLLTPEVLGTNSIAAKSFLGLDPSTAPESLIIARLLDYNILIVVPIFFIIIYIINNFSTEKKFLFSIVIILCFFSSLSNHPIAFIPLLTLTFISNKKFIKQKQILHE